MIALIHHPDGPKRLGEMLVENLSSAKWTHFRAAVAFVKNSGVKQIKSHLQNFLLKGAVKISAGVDIAGNQPRRIDRAFGRLG